MELAQKFCLCATDYPGQLARETRSFKGNFLVPTLFYVFSPSSFATPIFYPGSDAFLFFLFGASARQRCEVLFTEHRGYFSGWPMYKTPQSRIASIPESLNCHLMTRHPYHLRVVRVSRKDRYPVRTENANRKPSTLDITIPAL